MAIQLKAARVNANLTQEEVAKILNKSKNTIVNYEAYKSKPDIETAKKMAMHRQAVMEDFLEEFMAEWEGEK